MFIADVVCVDLPLAIGDLGGTLDSPFARVGDAVNWPVLVVNPNDMETVKDGDRDCECLWPLDRVFRQRCLSSDLKLCVSPYH